MGFFDLVTVFFYSMIIFWPITLGFAGCGIILGLVSAIIGAFLIANSILFEHPRRLVARYFGRNTGRLQSVREYVYNRVQTTLGFTFLLGGFALELVGQYQLRADILSGRPIGEPLSMFWIGLLVVVAVALLFSGWWWSLWAFRRYVREYFTQNPRDLESEPVTARELLRPTFRNWFRPRYPYVYATFRCVRDASAGAR